jgi:YhgE/Pip-like protein
VNDTTPPPGTEPAGEQTQSAAGLMHVRASQILSVPKIWVIPLVLAALFIALMATIYMGSVIDPTAQLRGLPVAVVNEDTGATAGGRQIRTGVSIVHALAGSADVSRRLRLESVSLAEATSEMDRGAAYATLVIPPTLSRSVVLAVGARPSGGARPPARPTLTLLENGRLGSLGVNLAAGVIAPAIAAISPEIGKHLIPLSSPASRANPIVFAQLSDPLVLTTEAYRPLPSHSALGLSAFYVSLIAIMSGFVGATLINSSIDGALGYTATELGPRWRHRRPIPINRKQTLMTKWALAVVATPLLTGILLLIAVGALRMYAPNIGYLWPWLALSALMISFGTLALLAALGALGQLVAMILLVYLSLASSGGTVPIQALPEVFRQVGEVEPLRNVLQGSRAILYFGARGDAGLTHSITVIGLELLFWALVGLGITAWYDHKKLYRLSPEILGAINEAINRQIHPEAPDAPATELATGPEAST